MNLLKPLFISLFSFAVLSCPILADNANDNQQTAKESDSIIFSAPLGWHFAEDKDLPKSVKVMVIGKGDKEFPPSINLGTEDYKGTLKQYIKRIKEINMSQGHEWKDLGIIKTEAGQASLSQVESKTKWGDVKMMHVILLKNNTIYIMTAAALKDEFPKFYKDFFAAFRSLRFGKTEESQTKIQLIN